MSRILLDLTHTSHTRARTGIQRVCRSLHTALAAQPDGVQAVCYDPYERAWRPLRDWERRNLASSNDAAAGARGAHWPLRAKLGGWLRWRCRQPATAHLRGADASPALGGAAGAKSPRPPPPDHGLVVPELFSAQVARALPALLARVAGPRVALFHDAIPLRLPELSPPKSVARFPAYLQELLVFDGVAAVSADSGQALVDYWQWLGASRPPPVVTLAPGLDAAVTSPYGHTRAPGAPPVVLSIGSLEGRKNHVALLEAAEILWRRGRRFELRLIGLAHPQTGRAALQRIHALQIAGRPVRYDGPADDVTVRAAYRDCAFTVYPSLMEGFGLPVLESLSYGRPCICSAHGTLGASARDGGCLRLEQLDASSIAGAVERLLADPECLEVLAQGAGRRLFKAWPSYARELTAWMGSLPRRGAAG